MIFCLIVFNYVLKPAALLRSQALKNLKMKRTLIKTFDQLISAGWLAPVDNELFAFVTKQKKPRVVFDGAASYNFRQMMLFTLEFIY